MNSDHKKFGIQGKLGKSETTNERITTDKP